MNPFLYNVVPQAIPYLFQGSSATGHEISMLENPRNISCGKFSLYYHYSHAHRHPFPLRIVNNFLQSTNNGSSLPIIRFIFPKQEKE